MHIEVHRGLEQIGGCITEISTATTRIFVDMGQNLPGVGEPTTEEQDAEMVRGLFARDAQKKTAVLYTHAHEDHVGLFYHVPEDIPQYISEGGKEILLAKYDLIRKGHELGHEPTSSDDMKILRIQSFRTWRRTKPQTIPLAIQIGDIRITPFFNCHSIYDSYMFLVEAEGQRIWHMGDYREHGYMGKGLIPTLKRYATDIDVLITEGTMLNRTDECIHEREVSRKMASVMNAFKYVFVLTSSTDIERLASIKEAARSSHKPLYICGGLMNRTMTLFTRREGKVSKGLFEFHPKFINQENVDIDALQKNGFVLVAGVNNLAFAQELCCNLEPAEVLLIYSSWDGYYRDPVQVTLNPKYKQFRDAFHNVVDLHTSGHADRKTIEKVIATVRPKETIYIHREAGAELPAVL